MKIKTQIITVQEQETEIELPAYFKDKDDLFKINADETIDSIRAFESHGMYVRDSFDSIKVVAGYTQISEAEWLEGVKYFLNNVHGFVFRQGLTDDGLPLPTPEDFGIKSIEEISAQTNV